MNSSAASQQRMREYLQLVATGPELSKSLSAAQAEDAMSLILDGEINDIQAGIFLIALRMKRETSEENAGAMQSLMNHMQSAQTASDAILSIADPFNGYLRGIPATPFLLPLLAACGLPSYMHGVEKAGPKYGITSHLLFKHIGHAVDLSVGQCADRLDNPDCGWAYIDQSSYAKPLHDLIPLRHQMVKRACISTLEVVLKPLQGKNSTHLMTGFVHKAYPSVYEQLARQAGYKSAAIVRGVEGGCIPSLSQVSRYFGYQGDGELTLNKLAPSMASIKQENRIIPIPENMMAAIESTGYSSIAALKPVIEYTNRLGLDALENKQGPMLDSLIYGASIALFHSEIVESISQGAELAREKIMDRSALQRFQYGIS